jgi:hypothetical protein
MYKARICKDMGEKHFGKEIIYLKKFYKMVRLSPDEGKKESIWPQEIV